MQKYELMFYCWFTYLKVMSQIYKSLEKGDVLLEIRDITKFQSDYKFKYGNKIQFEKIDNNLYKLNK